MKIVSFLLVIATLFSLSVIGAYAEKTVDDTISADTDIAVFEESVGAKSYILMEADSGKILCAKNERNAYQPASVTKIMTLLLVAEAIREEKIALTDTVTVSQKAAAMGGSQVFLKEGEQISVEELIKCTVIASANDAAYALAELVCSSEDAFVKSMNSRAIELGMSSTNFENVTGLDDTTVNHVTSAKDIAIMSRELLNHDIILKYSSVWQDTIRNGEFTLTNTNRLVRFYDGCNGLKTGSTSEAGYCMSATAKRDGMQLIAVVMGAETRDDRNLLARELLDFGFANYSVFSKEETELERVPVCFGVKGYATLFCAPFSAIVKKGSASKVEIKYTIPERISAPITESAEIGKAEYYLNGEKIGESSIYSKENIEKISFFNLYVRMLLSIFNKSDNGEGNF